MSEPLPDTWHQRDLPVLRKVVELYEKGGSHFVRGKAVMDALGIDQHDLRRAIVALAGDGLLEASGNVAMPAARIFAVSGDARRLAGSWPTPETGVDRLIAALENLAEHGTDDERTRAQKILDALGGAGQQIAVSVASAVITGQIT